MISFLAASAALALASTPADCDQSRKLVEIEAWADPSPDDGAVTLADADTLLSGTGVVLDEAYGPIPMDGESWVVRGQGSREDWGRAAAIPGVTLFDDLCVEPVTR